MNKEPIMTSPLSFEATSQILGSVKIPSAPAVFMQLHELMQQDEPNIDEVAETIQNDVALAALVLKTVNSPFFGLRADVKSIRQATMLLGLLNIGNIVAGLAMRIAMEEQGGATPDNYWDSPANVGKVAARLSQRFAGVPADEAYMLGLFHHVGVPLMMQRFDDYLAVTREAGCVGEELLSCEESRYQTNHAVVGYFVSRTWGLPEHIGELILRHHEVDEVLEQDGGLLSRRGMLLSVLKMAEHIDQRYWGRIEDPEWDACGGAVLAYAGWSSSDFDDTIEDMVDLLSQE
jgi:HD-like signal output (HDOD) protein